MTMHALETRTFVLPGNRHTRRREKVFGEGRCIPLDRNAKVRIMTRARALTRRTEPGKAYGVLTAKFVAVLGSLLFGFHNAKNGRCFPGYERIAEHAGCSRATVYMAIKALEAAGLLTWVNRIVRVREWGMDLFGRAQNRTRVIRTSNAYTFVDPLTQGAYNADGRGKQCLPSRTLPANASGVSPQYAFPELSDQIATARPTGFGVVTAELRRYLKSGT